MYQKLPPFNPILDGLIDFRRAGAERMGKVLADSHVKGIVMGVRAFQSVLPGFCLVDPMKKCH